MKIHDTVVASFKSYNSIEVSFKNKKKKLKRTFCLMGPHVWVLYGSDDLPLWQRRLSTITTPTFMPSQHQGGLKPTRLLGFPSNSIGIK